tara:strand:- start:6718 stop:8364 length:1647 start_codon:yes stop_codon:yes gene_type:complete
MAKKTTTGRIVDVAALGRIGRSQVDRPPPPNKSLDKFLSFAGNLAINLFAKNLQETKQIRAKDRINIEKTKADLPWALQNVTGVENFLDESGQKLFDARGKQSNIFGGRLTKKGKEITNEANKNISNVQISIGNLKKDSELYTNMYNEYKSVIIEKSLKTDKGQLVATNIGNHTPVDHNTFVQAFANDKLNDFIRIGEDGKYYLPKFLIDNPDKVIDENVDFLKNNSENAKKDSWKKTTLIPIEKWPTPRYDSSIVGNTFTNQLSSRGIQNANTLYIEDLHGKAYEAEAYNYVAGVDKDGYPNMTRNDKESWLYNGQATVGYQNNPARVPIHDFIDNPPYPVMIDIDDNDATPDVKYTGIKQLIEQKFPNKKEEDLTAEDLVELEKQKIGLIEELKTKIDVDDARYVDWMKGKYAQYAKNSHQEGYKFATTNPDSPNYIDPNKGGPEFTSTASERESKGNAGKISNILKKQEISFDDIQFMLRGQSPDLALELSQDGKSVTLLQTKIYQEGEKAAPIGTANLSNKKALEKLLWRFTGTLTQHRNSTIK